MKIFLRDLSAIIVRAERRVRFSVTFADDDGEPVATLIGWTIDHERNIRVPANRTRMGTYYPTVQASEKLLERIAAAVNQMKFVNQVLGPKVENVNAAANETSTEETEA